MTPDVTVLVAASRSDHPHHPVALRWLEDALAACSLGQRLTVLPMVAAGFLRLVTHPRVFVEPTPLAAAQEFLGAVITPVWGHRRWSHRSRLGPTTTPRSAMTDSTTCLGRTCLKWGPDGELTALDLSLVLERLAQVDQELTAMNQHTAHPQPYPSLS